MRNSKNLVVTLLVCGVLLLTAEGNAEDEFPLIIGHRGSSENYPENTMLAFTNAIKEGADGIELDIRKTNDGKYIVMHDSTLDRTTPGKGPVDQSKWSDISDLDAGGWKGDHFANQSNTRVLSLGEVLNEFSSDDILLLLHIKLGLEDMKKIADKVAEYGMIKRSIFFGDKDLIGRLKEYNPHCFVVNDGRNHDDFEYILVKAIDEDWNAISWRETEISRAMVEAAHENGLYIQASYLSKDYNYWTHD